MCSRSTCASGAQKNASDPPASRGPLARVVRRAPRRVRGRVRAPGRADLPPHAGCISAISTGFLTDRYPVHPADAEQRDQTVLTQIARRRTLLQPTGRWERPGNIGHCLWVAVLEEGVDERDLGSTPRAALGGAVAAGGARSLDPPRPPSRAAPEAERRRCAADCEAAAAIGGR